MIQIESLVVSLFESNCFIVRNNGGTDVMVVDPGDNAADILAFLRERQYHPNVYLITHGHVDHVSGLAELHRTLPAPVAMHPRDSRWAFSPRAAMPPYYESPNAPSAIERELADGQEWTDIGFTYQIIETPGHSPGGVAFYFKKENVLFSGDSLFRGSIGRSDLPGSNPSDLAKSLKRLMALPDATVVYCGHGPATTIGAERKHNPYLKDFGWAGGQDRI